MQILTATYISIEDVKINTTNNDIKNLNDNVINSFIIKAQSFIDDYIWDVEKFDENNYFKFPDINNKIPKEIELATLYLVENIFVFELKNFWKELTNESWEWYSVSYNWTDLRNTEVLTWNIANLLKKYWINKNNLNRKAFKINY